MSEMCCTQLAENTGCKNHQKIRHVRTIAQLCQAVYLQLRHVRQSGKNLLNSNISSTCPHNVANFGPLTAEIESRGCLGHPSKVQRVSRLAFVTAGRRSPEANQTLHDIWPSPGLEHYTFSLALDP